MKIFIDFDDVIFNTKQFVADLKIFFESNGIKEELFKKHYYNPDDSGELKLFNPWGMMERLEKEEKIDVTVLREKFTEHMKNLTEFLFDDVESFLSSIGKENVYLISFGLPVFQNEKILACGVDKLVSGCIVTKGTKSAAIKHLMENVKINPTEKIIFIDDRIEQVQDIKKAFPAAVTFLLCRKEGRYCDAKNEYCDYEIHSLKEAQEIIKVI